MKGVKILLILLVLVIIMVAAWQNIPPILEKSITFQLDLHWAKWQTEPIPLYLIIPVCFLAGFGLMWIIDLSTRMRQRRKVRALEKELRGLRAQTGYDSSTSLESYSDEPLGDEDDHADSDEAVSR
jgi:uncharacterized membrane protein YciS (DUF1049 family)